MSKWISVASVESFEQNSRQFIDIDNLHIAVVKINNDFYAFESMCTHAMYELDDAPIEDCAIECPLHGAKFCLKTGQVLSPPAYEDIKVFAVRIENNVVEIKC